LVQFVCAVYVFSVFSAECLSLCKHLAVGTYILLYSLCLAKDIGAPRVLNHKDVLAHQKSFV